MLIALLLFDVAEAKPGGIYIPRLGTGALGIPPYWAETLEECHGHGAVTFTTTAVGPQRWSVEVTYWAQWRNGPFVTSAHFVDWFAHGGGALTTNNPTLCLPAIWTTWGAELKLTFEDPTTKFSYVTSHLNFTWQMVKSGAPIHVNGLSGWTGNSDDGYELVTVPTDLTLVFHQPVPPPPKSK